MIGDAFQRIYGHILRVIIAPAVFILSERHAMIPCVIASGFIYLFIPPQTFLPPACITISIMHFMAFHVAASAKAPASKRNHFSFLLKTSSTHLYFFIVTPYDTHKRKFVIFIFKRVVIY
jgi:hypothetical protein